MKTTLNKNGSHGVVYGRRLVAAVAALLPLVAPLTGLAQYHFYNVASGSDCIRQDYRSPNAAGGVYDAINEEYVNSSDGGAGYFYGGFTHQNVINGTTNSLVQYVCWPASGSFPVSYAQQIPVFAGTNMAGFAQIGEGSSCAIKGFWPQFTTNLWMREAVRYWQPADGTPHMGYQGMWMKEPVSGNWSHVGTFKYPFAVTGVTGMSGWQEGSGGPDHIADYANGYFHTNGVWQMANQIQFTAFGYARLFNTNTAAECEVGSNFTNLYNVPITLTLSNQPALPTFDPIIVSNATASVYGSQLLVQWQVPLPSSPPLGYKVEVFTNASYTGTAALTYFNYDPEARQKMLTLTNISTPFVRLTISDIFYQTNTPILLTPTTATLSAATNVSGTVGGLNYQYYTSSSNWTSLPNFSLLTPVLQGAVGFPDVTLRQQRVNYGFNYSGYFTAPSNGLYAFTLHSGDGSRLTIDGTNVIAFDGLHDFTQFKSGGIALAAGQHEFILQFFKGAAHPIYAYNDGLGLAYEGPGITPADVPASAFTRVPGGSEPTIAMNSLTNGATLPNASPGFGTTIVSNGVTVNSVQFLLTDYYSYYFRPSAGVDYIVGQDATAPFTFNSMVWVAPTNLIRARLVYNGTNTIDSAPVSIATTNASFGPWYWTPLELHNYPSGAAMQGGTFSLVGDGMNLMSRQVTGDCTLVAHLANITPNVAGPDGVYPDSSYRAGIILRGTTNSTIGQPLGNGNPTRFAALFSTVGGGTYFEDDTMRDANGDANAWSGNLGGGNTWYKLQRTGNTFTSFVSPDGVSWTQVNSTNLPNFGTAIYAGVFIHSLQSMNPNLHQASFDNMSLIANGINGPASVSISPPTNAVPGGALATFTSLYVGPGPVAYQWQLNGTNIVNATNSTCSILGVTPANVGNYTLIANSVTSAPAMLVMTTPAFSGVWTNLNGGSWATSNNWLNGVVPVGGGQTANFATLNITADQTVTLDGSLTIGQLIFGDTTPDHNWILNTGTGGTLTLSAPTSTPTIIVSNQTATINAVLGGSEGLVKQGAGTLTLGGINTYTGGTTINAGTVKMGNNNALGTTGTITVNSGGTVDMVNQTLGATGLAVTLGGGTIKASAGGNALYANVTLAGGGTLGAAGSTYINWYCNIAGTGDLTIAGPVWAGGTRSITTTGKIIINPMSAGVYFQPGDGTLQCDEVVINGTLNPWATTISAISGNGQLVLQSSGLTINQNKDTTFAGTISGASGTWTKSGSFALTLTGANTYTGATTVNAGTLRVNGSIGTGAVTVNGSGTLGGTGVINGATTVQSGGVLAPGNNGISLLTVSNNVTLQGTTVMELSKAGGTWTNDQLAASGALTYGGALVLTNLSTNALVLSNSFKLFNAGSYAGAFQSVLPSPGYGMAWDTNQLAVNGTIVVGPPPATCTLTYLAGTNGTIVGQTPQTVAYGSNGTPVTAQANTGYLFVNWSDGGTNNPRTDLVVTADLTVTANFAVIAGQTLVWDANPVAGGVQDGSGVWGSGGTNWLFAGGNILWYDANTAVFGANTTTNCTVTIANDVTPAGIIFNATGGGSYTLAGGGGGINLAGSPTITASNSATISAVLKGMGSLTKAGSGTLTLSSTNAFTGGTTINAGILAFSSGTGMGAGSVTINDGGNLQIIGGNNYTVANPIGVSGAITISRTNNWIQTLSGSISGTGTLTLTSPTTGNSWDILTISGANSFSGTLIAGGALNLQFADFIWTGNPLLTLSDSYAVNLGNNTFAGLTGSGNGYGGAVTLNPAGNCTYSGVLSNATSIIISGTGTQTFSGTNTYTGTTTVSGGTLLINGVIGTNTVTVAVGGTLGGTGVIKGATTVQNGGVLAPGNNGLGKLTVSNSVTLAGGSTAMMELSRNGGVPTNSLAFISGTLTQGGSLVVANLGTNNLALGDSFKLFNAATYAGAFTNLTLPALTNGVNWNTSTLATNGTLSVIASTYMLNYLAAANGTVSGAATQTVAFGGSGTAVSAVANTGYRFVNWSDGSVANPRTDAGVTNNLTVTANFALLVPPVITNLNLAASGSSFSVTGTGATNAPYVLLGATNLPPVMWIPLLTNYADASGRFTLTDVQTTNYPRRFYRVLAQ